MISLTRPGSGRRLVEEVCAVQCIVGGYVKVCRRCGEEFEEGDNQGDPVTGLDGIFVESMRESRFDELCPKCRKEMKACRRCGEEFEESDHERNPVIELDDIFLKGMTGFRADDLCPKCRKKLAVNTLLKFDA